jgi:hypothetical protein
MHVRGHFAKAKGLRRIALAGGVALNCTANGKLIESGDDTARPAVLAFRNFAYRTCLMYGKYVAIFSARSAAKSMEALTL